MKRAWVVVLLVLMLAAPLQGREIGGVNLPDEFTAGKEQLVLNGAGLRTKFFIKVYAGGLYLKAKEAEARKIIDADAPMAIRMHFIYDGIAPEKLIEAWNEGFANATGGNPGPVKDRADRFNSFFTEEVRKGDLCDVVYLPEEGVGVYVKGKLKGTIKGLDFKKVLFAVWLGEKPADSSLKKGMLGK